MKRFPSLGTATIAVAWTLAVAGAALAAVVSTNGSFEDGQNDPPAIPGFSTHFSGDTSIDGWTVISGSIDYIDEYWDASDGDRSIDLSGNGPGSISQTFTTVIGATYTVTFDLAGNPAAGPATKTGTVGATGAVPMPLAFVTTGKTVVDMGWTPQTYSFVATNNSTTLTFTSTTAGFYGPAIDNVTVSDNIVDATDQCKDGGWQNLVDSDGNSFKNQGDCVSFVATNGTNSGAG